METARWHQEMDRFLGIKTLFLLEGNIFDLSAYPSMVNEEVRWDMVFLDNYIYRYL